jgi:phage repressor protein C with HTH and peptisase S24 domain
MVLMELQGDSMYPTLHPGDHLLIDTADTTPRQGSIMAFGIDDAIVAKRVGIKPDEICLISDNKIYGTITIKRGVDSGIRCLGRIV